MKWDYKNNLPVEGSYQKHQYDRQKYKEVTDQHWWFEPVVEEILASVDFNVDEFFLQKLYYKVPADKRIGLTCLLAFQLDDKPFLDYYLMELLDGDLNFSTSENGNCWWAKLSHRPINDNDILTRLYFCDCEEDIWDMVCDLPGDVASNLYLLYETQCESYLYEPGKAQIMTEYICFQNDWQNGKAVAQNIVIMIYGKFIPGNVTMLNEHGISVSLMKPIKCTCTFENSYYKLVNRAEDGNRTLTPEGEKAAIDILRKTYNDVDALLDDTAKIHAMLDCYHELKANNTNCIPPCDMLSKIRAEYYPDIEYIDFDIYLIEELEKYLNNKR